MKISIRKISDSYIDVNLEEGSTKIDIGWMDKKDAGKFLNDIDAAREDINDFLCIKDNRDDIIKELATALNAIMEAKWTPEGMSEELADAARDALSIAGY